MEISEVYHVQDFNKEIMQSSASFQHEALFQHDQSLQTKLYNSKADNM